MTHEIVRILSRPVGAEANSVDARELHQALESRQDFSTWIKARIEHLDFCDGVDFQKFNDSASTNLWSANRVDYALTIDAAKHIALAERTEAGRRVRAYFIEAERKLRSNTSQAALPNLRDPEQVAALLAHSLTVLGDERAKRIAAETQIEQLSTKVAEQAPKAEVYDRLIDCRDTLGFAEAAKEVKAATGANQNEFRALMLSRAWVRRLDGRLVSASVGEQRGYTLTLPRQYRHPDTGEQRAEPSLRVTQRGIARTIELLLTKEAS